MAHSNAPVMAGPGNATVSRRPWLTPTAAAHATFVPTGIVTVLLGPALPALSAKWSLNDAQAGELFTAQFLASTIGVALSGFLVPRTGYRLALVLGLLFMAVGVGALPLGSHALGVAAVACYGVGLGLTIPACNLLVAEVNPAKRAGAVSLLNFSWSVGAVACPFLLTPFQKSGHLATFFYGLAGFVLAVALLIVQVQFPRASRGGADSGETAEPFWAAIRTADAIVLGILFFVYVGTENAVGGWLASYAKRLSDSAGTFWGTTPSFFFGGLLAGRGLAPLIVRKLGELRMVRGCLAVALLGVVALLSVHSIPAVLVSASIIGLGLAAVYPITISLLSSRFGTGANRIGSVMFMLAGLGAATMPWMVGVVSTKTSSLQYGLGIPLVACVLMLALYSRTWKTVQ
jgi:FHS family glucose/mannose:H+ symporter-like MFS transporter